MLYGGRNSTTAEEVSKSVAGWCQEGHPVTTNLLQYPWIDNCLFVTGPLMIELLLVKCHQRFAKMSNPSLALKKANVINIYGDK